MPAGRRLAPGWQSVPDSAISTASASHRIGLKSAEVLTFCGAVQSRNAVRLEDVSARFESILNRLVGFAEIKA
jgi:hypothetical protein